MKKILILIITLVVFISCKKQEVEAVKEIKKNDEATLIFPDTVYINEGYDGKIEYKSDLDTITTSLDDVKKYRYIEYYFLTTNDKNYTDKHLKTIVKDTAYADNNRLIPLLYIKFDKLGLNYFDGIITDEVSIINGAKGKKGEPMTRIITHETRLTRGVYVIERPKK